LYGDQIREGRTIHQLHHQRTQVAGFLEAVNLRDVRMIEAGEHLRLAIEPGETFWIVCESCG